MEPGFSQVLTRLFTAIQNLELWPHGQEVKGLDLGAPYNLVSKWACVCATYLRSSFDVLVHRRGLQGLKGSPGARARGWGLEKALEINKENSELKITV